MRLGPSKNVSNHHAASVQQARAAETTAAAAAPGGAAEIGPHCEAARPVDAATQAATRAVKVGSEESTRASRLKAHFGTPAGAEAPRRGLNPEDVELAGKRSASGRRTADGTTSTTPKQTFAALEDTVDIATADAARDALPIEVNRRSGSGTKMSPPKSRGALLPEQIKDPSLLA